MIKIRFLQILWGTFLLLWIVFASPGISEEYKYEVRKENSHVVHIITLNQSTYETQFVKARNQVFGRETVDSMARRSQGEIAINAGFFEIGSDKDGMPSGTLLIDGKIFGFNPKAKSCLIQTTTNYPLVP